MLNTAYHFQHPVWGIGAVLGLDAHPKNAEQYQGEEADHGVSADTVGQTMEHGIDFDLALQYPESALDIGQRFVSTHNLCGGMVRHVGHQQQFCEVSLRAIPANNFSIEHPGSLEGLLIQVVLEVLAVEGYLEDMTQMSVSHCFIETGRDSGVSGKLAALYFPE